MEAKEGVLLGVLFCWMVVSVSLNRLTASPRLRQFKTESYVPYRATAISHYRKNNR